MVQLVVLSANGEQRTLKTTVLAAGVVPTGVSVAKVLRKTKPAEKIGVWKCKAGQLQLWGWKEGKAGTENKHELPPPHDEVLLFGDAVIICTSTGSIDLTVETWAAFYEEAFGGFEEIASEDSEEEDEEEEEADVDVDVEAEVEAEIDAEEEEEAEDLEEEEDEVDVDEDCYDDGDEGGGGKRRVARRRTAAEPEYRRIDMGLRARVKLPAPPGKRAPKWQSAPELEMDYGQN